MSGERRRASSGSPFEAEIGFSRAVRVGDWVLMSGTAPVWPDGLLDPRWCVEIEAEAVARDGRP